MIGRCNAIVLPAIVCITALGCRTPAASPMRPDAIPPAAAGSVSERPDPHAPAVRAFTIAFATFIPANHLLAPSIHPQAYVRVLPPSRLAFAGDDRGFDVDATSYRAKQVVTVVPDEADDADGLLEGSKQNLGGVTESFDARLALADGRIDEADRRGASADRKIKRGEVAVDTDGMIIDGPVRLGPHCVFVRLRTSLAGGPRNRLIAGSPSIDWDIGVTIDTSGLEPIYKVAGEWDGYPAAELYINRQPVFSFMPGTESGSGRDLLKLLPGHGDFHFVRTGRLTRPPERVDRR